MSKDVKATENEVVEQEDEDKIAEAAFLAEMSDTDDALSLEEEVKAEKPVEEPSESDSESEEPTADQTDEVEESVDETPERKELFAGYTEGELKEALDLIPKLRKSLDSVNGTVGTKLEVMGNAVADLTEKQKQAVMNLSPGKLERLEREFPELATLLSEDLNDWVQPAAEPTQVAPKALDTEVSTKLSELDAQIKEQALRTETRLLEMQHPDWNAIAGLVKTDAGVTMWKNPEFGAWVAKQDQDTQAELVTADDASVIAKHLTDFKATLAAPTKKKTAPRKAILENAVAPAGVPAAPGVDKTDDQIAHEAFLAEMSQA